MHRSKRFGILSLLLAFSLLAGCTATPPASSSSSPSTSQSESSHESSSSATSSESASSTSSDSVIDQLTRLYRELHQTELPRVDYSGWLETDPDSLDQLPQQLVIDTPEAYEYAQRIRNYFYFGGNILEDFDDPEMIYQPAAIQTALYHTTPINIWSYYEDGKLSEPYGDHQLGALLLRESAEGRYPSDLFYVKDVHETYAKLFGGDLTIYDQDVLPYYYYELEGVYSRVGDFGGPWWTYPMVTSIEETDSGVIVEIIEVDALDKDTPVSIWKGEESIDLTAENFAEATENEPILRYTFQREDTGDLILVGLQTIER